MNKLTIVATIKAHPNSVERVKAELEKLIPTTLAEPGCLQYDLHQDNDNPELFLFYENWESRTTWQDHMNAAHITAYKQATEGAVAEFSLYEMSQIG